MAKTRRMRHVFLAGVVSAALTSVGATSSHAGFEWKGAAPAPSPAAQSSSQTGSSNASSGGISWEPVMPAQKVQGIEAVPLTPLAGGNKPSAPVVAQAPVTSSEDMVSGFGSDLPLSVALQQVVPPSYKVALAPGVNADTTVSWSGDKPWRQVLTNMLSGQGLAYAVKGDTVTVKAARGSKPAARMAAAPKGSMMDSIPDDMISDGEKKAAPAPAVALAPSPSVNSAPAASKPFSMTTIRREKPAPLPEQTVDAVGDVSPVQEDMPTLSAAPAHAMPPSLSSSAPMMTPMPENDMAEASVIAPNWRGSKGQTLHTILDEWAKEAHIDLYWSTDYDYRLSDTVAYGGNFGDAVGKLLDRFSQARPQPYGRLHRGPEGNTVLVVNTYDTSN